MSRFTVVLSRTLLASPQKDLTVYGFYYFRTSLPFYLRRPVGIVTGGGGELTSNYIASHPDDVPLAGVPVWLLTLFDKQQAGLRRDGSPLLVRDGARNDTLFRLSCALRRFGVGEVALVDCVRGINREHCRPPLAEDEVRKIAASAARYAPGTIESPRKIKMKVV